MLKKALLFILILPILLLNVLLPMMVPLQFPAVKASPGVIYVRDDFPTIQEAVYNASLGDTIIVEAGIYEENLIVNQTVTLMGENKFTTIIDGEGIGNVVTFKNNSITMSGFTMRNGNNFSGIEVSQFDGHTIFDNIFLNNAFGVNLLIASGNTVVDNTLIDNSMKSINVVASNNNNISNNYVSQSAYGIRLDGSDNNFIINNTVSDTSYGIYFYSSDFVDVDNNKVSAQTVGIYSAYSSDSNIRHNIVSDCAYGIELYGATRNNVLNNTIVQSSYGIYLVYSNADEIDSNLVSNNDWGIYFHDSVNNIVVYNTASYNTYGIYLVATSTDSSIYKNNFIENTMQVFQHGDSSPNTWYTRIQGKDYGNYWSDYTGEDTDGDGVGDSPADSLPHWGVDEYPLMNPTMIVHDVAITNVETSSTTVYQGQIVNITVVARNEGTVNETFIVTAKYFDRTIGTKTVTNLTRYASTTLVFNWDTTDAPTGFNYQISAEAIPLAGETDTLDNTYTDGTVLVEGTIPGDIDGDGDVDRYDYALFAQAYGSIEGDPNYNPNADLDSDGDVDRYDFSIFASNYGASV